jgi:hypothetical protein
LNATKQKDPGANNSTANPTIIAAKISADNSMKTSLLAFVASAGAAVIAGFFGKRNQEKLKKLEIEIDRSRRLYQQFEPVLFQFTISCDNA